MYDNQSIILYVSPDEELISVRERLEKTKASRVVLVIPPQTQLRSHVAWRLLRSRVRELGQDVLVISADRLIRAVAKAAGFRVADSLESPPSDRPRPINRPVRSDRSAKTSQGSKQQAGSGGQESRSLKPGQQQMPPSSSKSDSILSDSGEIMETVPPPASAATDREDEDIDPLMEDYSLAWSIREAAQSTDVDTALSSSNDKPEQSSKKPSLGEIENDPFAYMEDIQQVALPEQRASTPIQDIDPGIPDISDAPPDRHEVEIEDLSDHDVSPHAFDDQMLKKPGLQETQRIYGTPPRSSRMRYTARPRIEDIGDEDELLRVPDRPEHVPPSSTARSYARPAAREQTLADPGKRGTVSPPSSSQRKPNNLPVSQNLDTLINHRIEELRSTGVTLAKIAERLSVRAMTVKTLLIFLGALVATREVASGVFGVNNIAIIVIYTLIGVLIATLAGLEVAFRWENRSIELKNLAANTRAERRKLESAIAKNNTALASESLLDALDKQSSETQEKSASLGVNIVLAAPTQPYTNQDMEDLRKTIEDSRIINSNLFAGG